jgi:hypothetical protein
MSTRDGTIRPRRLRRDHAGLVAATLAISLAVVTGVPAGEPPASPRLEASPRIQVKILPNGRVVVPDVFGLNARRASEGDRAEANIASRIAVYCNNYRSFFHMEYSFLRRICGPTESQRKRLARDAQRAFHEAIVTYEALLRNPQPRRPGAPVGTSVDPRSLIREGLLRVAETHLPAEEADRYREEIAERIKDRKLMAIQCIVAKLDRELFLSAEQRVQIACSLFAGWDDAWLPTESQMLVADRYCSRIPRERFYGFLDDVQRTTWDEAIRQQVSTSLVQPPDMTFPEDDDLVPGGDRGDARREVVP